MTRFSHLHVHSHYSLLEGLPKIPDLVARAKQHDMPALALTDSGNLYGAIEFYKECTSAGVKPIIGVDFYLARASRFDKEPGIDHERTRLVVLAEDIVGYRNLLKLVSYSYLEGLYYKPRIDRELLVRYGAGLIVILPSVPTEPEWWRETFDPDHLYANVEGGRHPDIRPVAIPEVYYLDPEDKAARDIVLAIQGRTGGSFDELDEDFSFLSPGEVDRRFADWLEAVENAERIAERCNLELTLGEWMFPEYRIESGKSADEELRDRVFRGFGRRRVEQTPELVERAEYELGVIKTKGYAPYFLVVEDFLRFARESGILSNIRGSVSGSLVTYLAGITNVNPIAYDIPFERFLNPDRPSAPDIDMDFADNRRDEVIDYARSKYGADRVAQIGTFGTMMARGAVRDVARAMGFPYALGDQIAKLIPIGAQGFPMTIDRALQENPDFQKCYEENPDARAIVDMAKKIEGNARHISVHAAGVVISPGPMTDYVPLQYDTKGEQKIITQYDMYSIDEDNVGLLKFDFLGLRNLSIIADALERIKKIEGIEIDLDRIPLDDKRTFEMLARGETEGTFQLNGDAMTKFLMELKPSTIHDINAMVALYRPGPMQFIPLFIERKHNPKLVTYLDPALEPILEKTYGVLVYQDDLLMIAREIAGYSWGEVDKFRKAVGKKIPALMAAEREHFVHGAMEHSGWSEKKASEVWTWLEPFAAYGFNKAHSVSYGRIAYITAYLKAHFPEIYMSAVLTAESGNIETIGIMVAECKRMGIEVLPPSVNESYSQFTVPRKENPGEKHKIRFGLTTIKNFGQGIATSIIEERKARGRYRTLGDFLSRVKDRNLNRKSLESLIKSGALDELPSTSSGQAAERGQMLANLDLLIGYHKEHASAPEHQDSLFSIVNADHAADLRLKAAPAASDKEKLAWEKELLGLYLSGHPLDEYRAKLSSKEVQINTLANRPEDASVVIGGLISGVREILTKKGDKMTFITLEDLTGACDVVAFPKVFEEFRSIIQPETCVAIKGRVSKRKGDTSIIAEKFKLL